ncbi:LolA family protein [Sporosarcina ureae]|uniref:LolA family protein n=1 Tax=Sporosarcina ureae TaxID=1571 RepID=UPI0009DC6304|nr:outer membrane lipoprotein carrier protein LolA [Sporosarcina ureae]ARF16452.1 hypothetical protein SporoP17a_03480 [Sporosarcina ureae]
MMKIINKLLGVATVSLLAFGLGACSEDGNQYSPEQVINNAMKENEEPLSYYAEATMKMTAEADNIQLKEWRSKDGKVKVETEGATAEEQNITVNDGETITMYQASTKQAFVSDDGEMLATMAPSPKEQAQQLLKMIGDSHTISIDENEKIAGRDAYHLVAKANDKDTLFGDQELWVDKENWFVLKSISQSGDNKVEIEYTKIEFNKEFPDETFVIELPDGTDIQDLDAMSSTSEVTIEEAAQSVGKPILYFPEDKNLKIGKIEMDDIKGELNRVEINIEYVREEIPLMSLSLFKSPENTEEDMKMPGEENVEIRGIEGTVIEMEGFRNLFWVENGVNYSILLNNPDVSFEEVIEWANDMELVE